MDIDLDDLDLDFEIEVSIPIGGWTPTHRIFPIMISHCASCEAAWEAPCPPRVAEKHTNGSRRESISHDRVCDKSLPITWEHYTITLPCCPRCQKENAK